MIDPMQSFAGIMAQAHYRLWYKEDVAPHLDKKTKHNVAMRISELTLRDPIWLDHKTNYIEDFPELKPYSSTGKISGLQLCKVMECIVAELSGQDFGFEKVIKIEKLLEKAKE